jgi:endoglucanase
MAYSSWILPTAVMCSLTGRWAARAKHGATGYHAARLRIALGRLHFTLIAASVSVFPLAVQADPTGGGGAPSSPATLLPPGPLHTKHSQIVDQYDRPVRLTCTGLYGPDTKASSIDAQLRLMVASGFNCVRMQTTNAGLQHDLAVIDPWVAGARKAGIRLIIDNHTNEPGKGPQDNWGAQQKNGLWYDVGGASDGTDGGGNRGTVTDAKFLNDWVHVARHYAGNDTVVGFDLRNEPTRGFRHGSTWGDGSTRDIRAMYQRVGNAIQAIDAGKLIIVEGVQDYGAGTPEGDLRPVASQPVVLNVPDHVVYSVHIYPKEISDVAADSGDQAIRRWNMEWGFLISNDIAPVWIGEMGSSMLTAGSRAWAATLVEYLNGTVLGGLKIPPGGQAVGTDWWAWGYLANDNPNGTLEADWRTLKPQQAAVYRRLVQAQIGRP